MARRFKLIIVLVSMLLLPGHALGQERTLARLTFSSGWDALPAIVGIERGFFAQEGLIVSGLAVSSGKAIIASLVSGSTDFAVVPQRVLLIIAAAKLPVKVVGMGGWGTEVELIVPLSTTKVKSLTDLKGKTIALGNASEAYPILMRLLNVAGMRASDVQFKLLDGPNLLSAFETKSADAIFETRYFTAAILQNGQAKLVLSNDDVFKSLGNIGAKPLIAGSAFLQREPKTAQQFLNAWVKALAYIQQDPEDAARLMQIFFHRQGTPVQAELAKSWVNFTRYDRYTWTEDDIADAEYNGWGLKEGQLLKVMPKLDGYVDNSLAQEAWQRLQN